MMLRLINALLIVSSLAAATLVASNDTIAASDSTTAVTVGMAPSSPAPTAATRPTPTVATPRPLLTLDSLVYPRYFSFSFIATTNLSASVRIDLNGRGIASFDNDDTPSLRLVYSYKTDDGFVQETMTGFGPTYQRAVFSRQPGATPNRLATFLFPPRACIKRTGPSAPQPRAGTFNGKSALLLDCHVAGPKSPLMTVAFDDTTGLIRGFTMRDSTFTIAYLMAQNLPFPDSTFARDQTPGLRSPCEFWMQSGQECTLLPTEATPTQLDVGRAEVNEKFDEFVAMSRPDLERRVARRLLPIVIGPPPASSRDQRARYFVIDGHHQMTSLLDAAPGLPATVYVVCNWRHMEESEFWEMMETRHWAFMITADGARRSASQLPPTFDKLGNNGYRALARLLVGRAIRKTCVPFAEFYWGQFLQSEGLVIDPQHQGSLDDLANNYLELASWIARKPEASFLPGYVPPGDAVPVTHPVCLKKVCDRMDDVEVALMPVPVAHCSLGAHACAHLATRFTAKFEASLAMGRGVAVNVRGAQSGVTTDMSFGLIVSLVIALAVGAFILWKNKKVPSSR